MSNGLRHFLGLLVGVLATPVLAAGLAWAPHWSTEAGLGYDLAAVVPGPSWMVPVAVLAVLGLLLGLLTGSRLSPLAALLPGLAIGAAGVVETAELPQPVPMLRDLLTADAADAQPWFSWGPLFLLTGAALVFSALAPSRWRRRRDEDFDYDDDPYGGYAPPPAHSGTGGTPPAGTESTQTMSWDADGMPPRYHVSDPRGQQPPAAGSAGWNDPHGDTPPPRWPDRGSGS